MRSENTYSEIRRQAKAIESVNSDLGKIEEVLETVFESRKTYDEVICIGCGTSLYIAQSVSEAISSYAGIQSRAVPCSEIYYFAENYARKDKNILVMPFTRNSKTTEVRKAIDKIRSFPGITTLSVTCDPASIEYNDHMICSPDAKEKSVVMTSSYTSLLYLGIVTALFLSEYRKHIAVTAENSVRQMRATIEDFDKLCRTIVYDNKSADLFVVLGQGVYYGVANECMNKIKEMAIENSEAYHTLEYRHGPMSIVDGNTMILIFTTKKTLYEDRIFIREMITYGAKVFCISINCDASGVADVDHVISSPLDDIQSAVSASVAGQLIGYYRAELKGIDADNPRHLSQAIILKDQEVDVNA